MEKKRSQRRVALLVLSAALASGLLAAASDQEKAETVRVVVRFAKVRSQPSAGAPVVRELGYGTMLQVREQIGDYFLVTALNVPASSMAKPWYVLRGEVEAVSAAEAQPLVENRRVTYSPEAPLAGQQVIFTASHFLKPGLLKWDMGDGTVLTSGGKARSGQDVNLAYSYAAAGKFLVRVYDEGGQAGSVPVSVQVTVSARARALRADPEEPLAQQPVTLTAVDFLTPERIAWDLGDGSEIGPGPGLGVIKPSFLVSHVYGKEGTYTVKAYDSGGDRRQKPVTLELRVKADPRAIRALPAEATPGSEIEFSAGHFNTPDDLRWDMGDGTLIPAKGETGIRIGSVLTYRYAKAGEYRVKVYDWNGDMGRPPVEFSIVVGPAATAPAQLPAPPATIRAGEAPAAASPLHAVKKYNLIKIGPYAGYFQPQDGVLKQIYGKGDVLYGGRIGIHVWNGFYIWLSASRYQVISKTTFSEDKTTLTLTPFSAFLRYGLRLGFFTPYAGIGFTYLDFNEESLIGNTKGNGSNTSYEAGFELRMNRHFFIDLGARYNKLKVSPTGFDIDLGGVQAGLSLLVSF
jgi:opacity protein-like surface antigen